MRRARPSPAVSAGPSAAAPGPPAPLSLVADLLVLLLAAVYLVVLWRQASGAIIASDECFHVHLSEWIARHGRLPRELPEFYSGLPYFYPPLLHLLGAGVVAIAGVGALKYSNVVMTGVLFGLLAVLPVPSVPRAPRLWALLLCLANVMLAGYAVRFYAETLATVLAVLVTLLLLRLREQPSLRAGIGLGVAAGAALLAKQSAMLIPGMLAVLAAFYAIRRQRVLATALLAALVVAAVTALPFFARNAMLFGSPFYPPATTEAQQVLDVMTMRTFSLPLLTFYWGALQVLGPVALMTGIALLWNLLRRRFDLTTGLLALCAAFILVAPWVPLFRPRHLLPVAATMALLASLVLHDRLRGVRWGPLAVQMILIGWTAWALMHLPPLRASFDATPEALEAYQAIRERVPVGATVLSLWTYDTYYYGRRNATWPVPWGDSGDQLALFLERDPARFAATLDSLSLDYILVPRHPPPPRFSGANYPENFVGCVIQLIQGGQLRLLWQSRAYALVARVH